jgi:glycosyltransferase involved in cell wall biosynthesis
MTNSIITIVIPVYNRAKRVQATLDSICRQTARPIDLVLVDNASTDNSLEVLEHWRDSVSADDFRVTILSEPTKGACAARNCGLAAVDSEWVMFFDSDDLMLPDHLERTISAIKANPEADIIGWNVRVNYADGSSIMRPFEPNDIAFHNLFHGTFATQRYCVRTALARKAGGWNNDVPAWNDIEFGARLLAENPHIVHRGSDITVEYISHEDSISGVSYAHLRQKVEPSLQSITRTLPRDKQFWPDLKRVLLYATAAREGDTDSKTLYNNVMQRTPSTRLRLIYSFAYNYTRHGGRGAARLLRRLI